MNIQGERGTQMSRQSGPSFKTRDLIFEIVNVFQKIFYAINPIIIYWYPYGLYLDRDNPIS